MPSPLESLVYGLIFVSVLLLMEGISATLGQRRSARERRRINERLRLLGAGEEGRAVLQKLLRKSEGDLPLASIGPLGRMVAWLDARMTEAGMRIPTRRILVPIGWATVATGAALAALTGLALPVVVVLSLMMGALPILLVAWKAKRRMRKFARQLPHAVETVVRSLKAGHPVNSAINMVAREMPDPIGSEFGLVFDEMTYGLDLRGALDNLAARVPIRDLHFLVVAVRIQSGTGGNLAEVLSSLAHVMRERERLAGKVKALSAEGRLSATILSVMPFLVAGAIFGLNPGYYNSEVMSDPMMPTLIGLGVGGVLLGVLLMARIVRMKV